MIRLGAIFLASLMLVQSFGITLPDLVQMDELLEHARFHKEQYGDDFISFFAKHYGEQKEEHHEKHQEEQSEHDQLPFQNISQLYSLQTLDKPHFFSVPLPPVSELETALNFHYLLTTYALHPTGVFQPPRQA